MLLVTENTIRDARPLAARFRLLQSKRLKRALDVTLALLALIFASPLMLTLAAVLYAFDGGPVIFRQKRIGAGGKVFDCLKFRSMRRDAAARLQQLLDADPVARREWTESQKLRHDPRIHALGHILRISSLDELPQLINVLKGEMSLVGPRPIVADEMERYGDQLQYYLALKPGLTGLWQVSGRNDTSYALRVRYDVEYFHTRSLLLDLSIMVRTVGVVLFARNGW
jgi:lipopolysaccharide/colanic/teichoic acid biosynthesis glycosyltransferase